MGTLPSFKSAGVASAGVTASPLAVAFPASVAAGDVALCVIEAGLTSGITATGWTQLFLRSQAAVTGSTVLVIMGRICDGSEGGTSPSFTIAGTINHASGQIALFQNAGVGDIGDIEVGAGNGGAAATTGTALGVTVMVNALVIIIASTALDANSTTVYSAFTNANLGSITERMDNCVLTGNGGGFGMAEGSRVAGGATGNSTWTQTSEAWNGVHVYLPPRADVVELTAANPMASGAGV